MRLRDVPAPIRFFWVINVVMSGACALIMRGSKRFLHLGYPYDFPLYPFGHWYDFSIFKVRFLHLHSVMFFSLLPTMGERYQYPAAMALLYKSFYVFGSASLAVFLFVTLGLLLVLSAMLGRKLMDYGFRKWTAVFFLGSILIVSYPFWFEYCLGNMDICIFLMLAIGVLAFLKGRGYLAAALIGSAAAIKIYPGVYMALLLSRKQYRELAVALGAALVTTLAGLWLIGPSMGIAYRGIEDGLARFREHYMLTYLPVETSFDHSIFAVFKRTMFSHGNGKVPPEALTVYLAMVAVVGIALYFLRIRKLPMLNQILCLCIASILLPPTSHDYTLIHLYVPFGLLVLYAVRLPDPSKMPGLTAAFLCLAFLFSPESEFILHGAGYGGQLKAGVLVILMGIGLTRPWAVADEAILAEDGDVLFGS